MPILGDEHDSPKDPGNAISENSGRKSPGHTRTEDGAPVMGANHNELLGLGEQKSPERHRDTDTDDDDDDLGCCGWKRLEPQARVKLAFDAKLARKMVTEYHKLKVGYISSLYFLVPLRMNMLE